MNKEDYFRNYEYLRTLGTGGLIFGQNIEYITVSFGKYVVKVRVNEKNEFLGIEEIGVDKEFLSLEQRNASLGSSNVDQFYFSDD